MAADQSLDQPNKPSSSATSVAQQSSHRAAASATDRLVRQIQNVDAWMAARREREQALSAPGLTRDQRLDGTREIEVLRRTHDAIQKRCERGLADQVALMRPPGLTAVIAHRHPWFVDRVVLFLGGYGVTVLECTDNGADALGAVIAEQPDVLLAGDRLAMMSGHALLTQARLYAANTLLAGQAADQDQAIHEAVADAVFLRRHPPEDIADTLVAMLVLAAAERDRG